MMWIPRLPVGSRGEAVVAVADLADDFEGSTTPPVKTIGGDREYTYFI